MARLIPLLLLAGAILSAPEASGQDPATSFAVKVRPFLESHCTTCHGPDVQKAGLRLDTLGNDLHDGRTMAQWIRVYDKVISGEMPPKKRERPPQRDLNTVTELLSRELYAASLGLQQRKGRVAIRRLNGVEYENTVRDLLSTDIGLKELLPEDNTVAGFDNVGEGLDLSATHLLLYQEAAEKAIASVVPMQPQIPFSDKRTGRQMSEKGPNFRETLGRSCRLEGDALIFHGKLPRYGLCSTASVPHAGRYRVQMSVCAVGTEGNPLPVGYLVVNQSGREEPVVRDCREIPAGKLAVIEVEVDLKSRQAFVLNLFNNFDLRPLKISVTEYKGPGLLVEWMKIEGPIDPWPSVGYQRLFANVPLQPRSVVKAQSEGRPLPKIAANRSEYTWNNDPLIPASADPKRDTERLLRDFLPRAFRRPVSEEVQRYFVERVHDRLDSKYSFYDAMMYGYKSILSSPHFLFILEPGSPTLTQTDDFRSPRLDDYALASRLAYFLWSTSPDEELLAVARKGELTRPEVLRAQVERMLASGRAHRFTENFAGQWLDLRKINATIPDPQLYGDFDGLLLWSMPRESELYFEEVLRNDLSLLEFVDSDWTMLNERLATHYGIASVKGNEFRKVKLPPGSHRGGVMTHASVLKVTADGTRTSPVLRGKWVLERILGKPPAPPPPDVPAIEPDIRGATTIRQQLDKHRNTPACATCHVHIDPPGFALENFDPIGGWRDFYRASAPTKRGIVNLPNYTGRRFYRGPDVEKGGQTPEGRTFNDIDEYKKLLLEDRDQLARNLTQKLLIFATGADLQFADREVVEQIVARLRARNYGFRTLVHEVVQSRLFLNK